MKRKIGLIIAICVFLFSAYKLLTIWQEYHKGTEMYQKVEEEAVQIEQQEEMDSSSGETVTRKHFRVDFEKLLTTNEETIAWIRFDKPEKISYPVVQTTDNSTYLTKGFNGQQNSAGTLFADMVNANDFSDKNTFIYGHNMKNGAMFGRLREYKSEKFCKKNPYFYIYTADGKVRTYQVFSVEIVENNSESFQVYFSDENPFVEYVKMIRENSLYQTDAEVGEEDLIVSLSTCTNVKVTERMIVHGVLIKVEESE